MVRTRKTAGELMAELRTDPEYRRRQKLQEETLRKKEDARRFAELPLVRALGEVGIEVGSVWDLVNTSRSYAPAVPVLLTHLRRSYPRDIREGIARALAVPEAKIGWSVLLQLFRQNSEQKANGFKWALGCALAGAADDTVIDDVISLVNDPSHGENRAVLLSVLAKSRRVTARAALETTAADPQLSREAQSLLRAKERKKSRPNMTSR